MSRLKLWLTSAIISKTLGNKALNDMERQRQDIKNALYQMTVWNSFSPEVVQKICNKKTKIGKSTIEGIKIKIFMTF